MHSPANIAVPPATPADAEAMVARNEGGSWVRVIILALGIVAAMLVVHLTPVRAWLSDAQQLRATLKDAGAWVYPLSIVATAILVGCGVPRLLFCAACGLIFGFWAGFLLSQIGTLLGQYITFLFVRWGGREWALHRWPRLRKWAELIRDQGMVGVILIRQVPSPSVLTNLCLGLSNVKHRHFLIGTAIGLIPEAVPATLIGAGLVKASLKDSAGYLGLAAFVFALIWIVAGVAIKKMRQNRTDVGLPEES